MKTKKIVVLAIPSNPRVKNAGQQVRRNNIYMFTQGHKTDIGTHIKIEVNSINYQYLGSYFAKQYCYPGVFFLFFFFSFLVRQKLFEVSCTVLDN